MTMRWSVEKKIATGFALTLAILFIVGIVSYRNTRQLINDNNSVAHAHEILDELDHTLALMTDAETGQRGFIITGDEQYLEPYVKATAYINQHIERLKGLIANEPELRRHLPTLEQDISERLKISAESIAQQRAKGFDAAKEVIATGRGRRMMDAIRATIAEMSDEENQILERRSAESAASARNTIITLTIFGLLLLALLPVGYLIIRRDLTRRRQTEEALRESEDRYKYLIEHADELIYRADINGNILFVNPTSTKILKFSEEELIGQYYLSFIKPELRETAEKFYRQQFIEKIPSTYLEIPIITKDGKEVWIGQNAQLVLEQNRVVGFQAVARDITERRRTLEELHSLSLTDDLTGLYNRRGFFSLAEQQLKQVQRNHEQAILVFADLDGLKQINDHYGHQEGSNAIVKAADILRQTFRAADILARLGGDEFTVLATTVSDDNAKTIETRLQQKLNAFNASHELPYDLSLSIGIARLDPLGKLSIEELMRQADAAMYEHKQELKAKLKI
jgi:diguanylate cyclase (GGDEF)-like protein/PAS domain S-box-containing protein